MSQNSKTIAIGKVEGDYDYEELTPDIKHIRRVKWLSKNILKSEFGEDIIKQLQIRMTVYQIKKDDIISTIKQVLQKSGITDIDIGSKTDDEKSETENKVPTIFVTGYDNENLSKSKELGILGWKYNSRLLSAYDLVFVFNKSNLNIESCFEMRSKSYLA